MTDVIYKILSVFLYFSIFAMNMYYFYTYFYFESLRKSMSSSQVLYFWMFNKIFEQNFYSNYMYLEVSNNLSDNSSLKLLTNKTKTNKSVDFQSFLGVPFLGGKKPFRFSASINDCTYIQMLVKILFNWALKGCHLVS